MVKHVISWFDDFKYWVMYLTTMFLIEKYAAISYTVSVLVLFFIEF